MGPGVKWDRALVWDLRAGVSFPGVGPADASKTASSCNWTDVQRIKGTKHVFSFKYRAVLRRGRRLKRRDGRGRKINEDE